MKNFTSIVKSNVGMGLGLFEGPIPKTPELFFPQAYILPLHMI